MEMLKTVQENVVGWSVITIIIVVASIVLLNFKDVDGVTTSLNTTIDTSVAAIDEPISWIGIVFVAVIGVAILGLFIYLMRKFQK